MILKENKMSEEKKQFPPKIGAIWRKSSAYGEYLSIQVEINGVKHNFTAFPNRFYEEGGRKPAYEIAAPKAQSQPSSVADKYEQQISNIMAQKEAVAKKNEQLKAIAGATMIQSSLTEEDLPF